MSDTKKNELVAQDQLVFEDQMTLKDKSGRRQFIRRGAAFVAVGSGLAASSQAVYADDCDRNQGQEKNAQAPGSDSDTGASADPTGCGRREPPKISSNANSPDPTTIKPVKTINA